MSSGTRYFRNLTPVKKGSDSVYFMIEEESLWRLVEYEDLERLEVVDDDFYYAVNLPAADIEFREVTGEPGLPEDD
jgi:hypothetical protein